MTEKTPKIIHVAEIINDSGSPSYIFLKKMENHFRWYIGTDLDEEIETEVHALNIEEAIRLASRKWKYHFFQTLGCGFRYTLPERDEHGINALFHQMVSSYSSMNGVYYDEELGNNCFVQNASNKARQLWQHLKTKNCI